MGKRIRSFIEKVWPGAFGQIWAYILTFLFAVGLLVWAWLKKWFASTYAPLTILIVLILIILSFSAFNQIRKFKRGKTINYQELILKWLLNYRYSVEKADDAAAEWIIKSTHISERHNPFFIAVFKAEPDFLQIFVNSNVEVESKLDEITSQPTSTLIEELQIEMIRLGLEYRGLQHPLRKLWICIKMNKDDTLTQLSFLQNTLRVRSALSLLVVLISKYRKLYSAANVHNP